MPDESCRREIWKRHLVEELPIAEDISLEQLAQVEDVCGRDIKNAVIDAAMRAARQGKEEIEIREFIDSVDRIKAARINVTPEFEKLAPGEEEEISKKLKEALAKKEQETAS